MTEVALALVLAVVLVVVLAMVLAVVKILFELIVFQGSVLELLEAFKFINKRIILSLFRFVIKHILTEEKPFNINLTVM